MKILGLSQECIPKVSWKVAIDFQAFLTMSGLGGYLAQIDYYF